jgi:hypothetical protein
MFPPIFSVVSSDANVLAVLGANPVRFFLFGLATPATPKPYAVWQTIGGSPENYLDRRPDIDSYVLQVDIYGTTAAQCREAARAVRDAIELHCHITSWRGESRDPETGLYRLGFDVDWWEGRE